MAHFAVIGAGLAGMSLAKRLEGEGHRCSIFEKSRGRGGRLSTRRLEGWQADHGAQYFTARSEQFKTEVAHWIEQDWASEWALEPWKLDGGELVKSPDDEQRFVGVPTMNAMVHGLSRGLDLHLNTRVERLERRLDNDKKQTWQLWGENDQNQGVFDGVLLTAPLPQTLELLSANLMHHISVRYMSSMTPTWAVGIAFCKPSGIEADAIFASEGANDGSDNGVISWLAKDSSKPGRPLQYETWICHFSSTWSASNLDASEEVLHRNALTALQVVLDKTQVAKTNPISVLPQVHSFFKHRWLYAKSAESEPLTQSWNNDQKIGIAGDWTVGGRVEDAWRSAQQLADQIGLCYS